MRFPRGLGRGSATWSGFGEAFRTRSWVRRVRPSKVFRQGSGEVYFREVPLKLLVSGRHRCGPAGSRLGSGEISLRFGLGVSHSVGCVLAESGASVRFGEASESFREVSARLPGVLAGCASMEGEVSVRYRWRASVSKESERRFIEISANSG